MAYNNVSYASTIRILEGREKESEPVYDRYNEAEKWPKLPPIGSKLPYQDTKGEKESERERRRKEERRSRNETRVRVNTEQENRNRKKVWGKNDQAHQRKEILNRKRGISDEKTRDYYKQFDTRMIEVTKGRYGIAIEGPSRTYATSPGEASSGEWDSEEEAQKEEEKGNEKRGFNRRTRYEDKGPRPIKDTVRDIIAKFTYYTMI